MNLKLCILPCLNIVDVLFKFFFTHLDCNMFNMLYNCTTFESMDEILNCDVQMMATEQSCWSVM